MKVKVEVSPYCILVGRRYDDGHCPIAVAVKQAMDIDWAEVAEEDITVGTVDDAPSKTADLPRSARRFIKNFDRAKDVSPFNFVLEFRTV
jgi:hypothetical protein